MESSITALLLWCALQGVGGQAWSVVLPEELNGLEGSCVKIPCKFLLHQYYNRYLDNSCKAQWSRSNRELVFDSNPTEDVKHGQGQLVGNLLNKDCTTILHNLINRNTDNIYYFRLECNALKIDFYPGVKINFKAVRRPMALDEVTVQEGSRVTLSCSAWITCPLLPPTLSWAPSLGDAKEEATAKFVASMLTFNASFHHHGERIICSTLYKRQAGHSNISFTSTMTINVLYAPTNVSVEWPPGPALVGNYVRLSCKGSANPPVDSYAWYRSRLHPGLDQGSDQGPLGFDQTFTVLVSEDTQFYCGVRNFYGAQNSSLTQMDVHFPPKEVELTVEPPGVVQKGLGFTLRCSSQAQPPASEYDWYWVSGRTPGIWIHLPGNGANFTVERAEQRHGGQYYCLARNYVGQNKSAPLHLDILFAAEILSSSYCVRLPSGVRCICESQGKPVPSLAWQLAGEAVNHSAQRSIREIPIDNQGIISVISLAQSDKYPPTVVCHSNNSVGADRLKLNFFFAETQPAFHAVSLLIGWGAGAVVMTLLLCLFHITFCRKKSSQRSEETSPGNSSKLVRAEQMEVVYANKAAQGAGEEEELHYVDVRSIRLHSPLASNPGEDIIRGMDSKTAVYAQIRPHHTGSGDGEPQEENVYAENVSSALTGAGEEDSGGESPYGTWSN